MESKKEEKTANKFTSMAETSVGEVPSLASLVASFLEGQGFQVYRIQSTQEAYEVRSDLEVLRIYVTRRR